MTAKVTMVLQNVCMYLVICGLHERSITHSIAYPLMHVALVNMENGTWSKQCKRHLA